MNGLRYKSSRSGRLFLSLPTFFLHEKKSIISLSVGRLRFHL